ncbi:CoA pyrophosphatase [Janibacter sp. DB-40]|uniref:NUDIX hydrolase n=1 Tax=Janibacter sp. DB-40 TaxID=3028808 RepID=UPI00240649E8|nr:CoA pyrophosphatase [Janibacter sp. DB-40]
MTGHTGAEPPEWLLECEVNLHADLPDWFTRFEPPDDPPRRSAVLMLFGPGDAGPRVVLTERSETLRSHASQVSFPGGKLDPGETAVQAALRETWEEVGVDPSEVEVIGSFPDLWLGPSSNAVTPVLGWVREPHPLRVIDRGEVARVEWVPVADLVEPANRFTVKGPSGYVGPGFDVADLFVWGFTAQLLAVLIEAAGIDVPWDEAVRRRLPWRFVRQYLHGRGGRR